MAKRLDIKAILSDPKQRKRLLEGACRFLIAIGRYT
jgi:hypothetical protein